MSRMFRLSVVTCAAVMTLLALSGCEQVATQVIEDATGVRVQGEGDQVTVTTEQGGFTVGGQEIPEHWPPNAPVIPDATIVSSVLNEEQGARVSLLTVEVEGTLDAAATWYIDEFEALGWTITFDTALGGTRQLNASKEPLEMALTMSELGTGGVTILHHVTETP